MAGAGNLTSRFNAVLISSLVVAAVSGCVPASTVPEQASPKPPVRGERHMVVAAHPLAAEAGRQMLRRGGSAVDAAIATQMVLNLIEPQSSGIGGGGFLLHFQSGNGKVTAFDGRETAPASAYPEMFLDRWGRPREFFDAVVGGLSVGVPGLLRMLEDAHDKHGRLPWADLFQPAIELAESGFPVSPRLHTLISRDKYLKTFPETAAYFYDSDGAPLPVGTRVVNRAFAETLREVAQGGAQVFYGGAIAADVVRAVRTVPINPGGMTMADLASYRSVERPPVCGRYRSWRICGMPPPSSGGITTLQILGLLERFPLRDVDPQSVESVHLLAEASRLAFADRNTYVADPDFVPVPTAGLLDPIYLRSRSQNISEQGAAVAIEPGLPPGVSQGAFRADQESFTGMSTTHISVIDGEGNAVAMTSSIENAFGSRLMVRGFLLNNELTDFSFVPEREGTVVANRAEAGKRPRSSMAPTLVLDDNNRLLMVIGSPGGSRIIGYVAKTLLAVLDWERDIQAAIDLPNVLNRNGPTELEKSTAVVVLQAALEKRGHTIEIRELTSGLNGIVVTDVGLEGGADARREGVALAD